MSWSARAENVRNHPTGNAKIVIEGLEIQGEVPANVKLETEAQLRFAKRCALELLESGTVGDPNGQAFDIALAGHATTGFSTDVPGYASDMVWVQVTRHRGS